MQVKKGYGQHHEKRSQGIHLTGRMQPGIKIREAKDSHSTAGKKNQPANNQQYHNHINHYQHPLQTLITAYCPLYTYYL